MIKQIVDKFDRYFSFLMDTKYYFIYIPLIVGLLGFVETVGVLGEFIPMELISISAFALLHQNIYLFLGCVITFSIGIYMGFIVGYFIGKKYCKGFVCSIEKKYPVVSGYFVEINQYIDKYHIWAFPILINLGLIRPFISIYFGSRSYDFKKYLGGCFIATISYVVPRAILGYFVGIFGKVIFDYLKIGYKYILYALLVLIVLAFVADFFIAKKELKSENGKEDFLKKILKKK